MNRGGFEAEEPSRYDQVSAPVEAFSYLTLPLAKRIVSIAATKPTEKLLDVGTGTGIIANLAGRRVGLGGGVVGVDFSEGMLERAKAIASREGLQDRVEYQLMDAQDLKFTDQSFDCVVSLFTFMHLPDPKKALREMFRVLKPKGRVVIGLGSRPPLMSLRGWIHRVRMVLLNIGRLRGKVLLAPDLLNSLVRRHLSDPETKGVLPEHWEDPIRTLTGLARESGLHRTRCKWEGHLATFTDAEEFWILQTTFSSFARQRLLNAVPEKVTEIRKEFRKACEDVLSRRGRLVYHYAALFVTAHKP